MTSVPPQAVPDAVARHYVAWLTSQTRHLEHDGRPESPREQREAGPTVTVRPYASPLPLGFFSFAVGMVIFGGIELGWLTTVSDVRTAGILMMAFVFPLEFLATVFALLARDTPTAATLGLYSTTWLSLGLLTALDPAAQTSRPEGMLLGAFTVMLVPLAVAAAFGKIAVAAVLTVSVVRTGFAAAYQLGAPHWTDRAGGIGALVLLGLACYAGTAFLIEDLRGGSALTGRRGKAAAAMPNLEHGRPDEPGVREQL